jgi:hypothetical protein
MTEPEIQIQTLDDCIVLSVAPSLDGSEAHKEAFRNAAVAGFELLEDEWYDKTTGMYTYVMVRREGHESPES